MEAAVLPDRRLLWAVGLSVAVHAAAVAWLHGPTEWTLRWPAEVPRVLDVVVKALPETTPEPLPARVRKPAAVPRTQAPQPAAGAAPALAPTPVLTAPAEAPAGEFRVPAAPAPPREPPSPARAPVAEAPVTVPRFDADYLENPPPPYPLVARRRGLQGTVRLEVLVGRDGRVRDLKLAESSGHADLDDAALRAVRDWRFVPARRGGEPVDAPVIVPVRFQIGPR